MAENPQDPNNTGPDSPEQPGEAGGTPPPAEGGMPAEVPKDVRTMGMLCHLLALVGIIIPFGNILGPLIIWLIKKDEHPFIDDQGKESLNFQITVAIAGIVLFLVTICLMGLGVILVGIYAIVMVIIASIKANEGVPYRYPLTLRLIK